MRALGLLAYAALAIIVAFVLLLGWYEYQYGGSILATLVFWVVIGFAPCLLLALIGRGLLASK